MSFSAGAFCAGVALSGCAMGDHSNTFFDPPGTGNVFVLITGATDTIASFKVPEVPA